MTTFPILLPELFGQTGAYLVYATIGFLFGFVLEMAGFANSRKLAAQFYFTDMTVFKVMFGAIVTAMVLIFITTGLGWLDYNLLWVNPTYLWPGIVGGLIMGVGFIVGGFCPGTSLVAAATAKIDGIFFVLGVLVGILLFGETVEYFEIFWNSSYMGRFTLMDFFGISTGWVVLGVVLMALFMFWGAEKLEAYFGGQEPQGQPKWRRIGAGALVFTAVVGLFIGQPDNAARWQMIAAEQEARIAERAVQIEQGELLSLQSDRKLNLVMLDVRSEADYNLFHLRDARHMPLENLLANVADFHAQPPNTVFVLMSNDETAATAAWRMLQAESVPNVYLLEGGVNGWLDIFAPEDELLTAVPLQNYAADTLKYQFMAALGARTYAARPDLNMSNLFFTPKVKLEMKRAPGGGGCG